MISLFQLGLKKVIFVIKFLKFYKHDLNFYPLGGGVVQYFQKTPGSNMWPHLGTTSFHPTARARQEDGTFNFAKARNAAINTAGGANTIQSLHRGLSSFKLADSPTDSLSSKDSDLSHPSYQRLMTKGDKGVVSGMDSLRSDPMIKLASEFRYTGIFAYYQNCIYAKIVYCKYSILN